MATLKFVVDSVESVPEAHRGFYTKVDGKWRLQAEGLDDELKRRDKALAEMQNSLDANQIDNAFQRSKFIAEKLTLPADLIRATFGSSFKVEEGKLVAYDGFGLKIYSRSNPGKLADFDEALGEIIDAYPHKKEIMKQRTSDEPASRPDLARLDGHGNGTKTMSRAAFDQLNPADRMAKMKEGYTLTN